MRYSEYRQRELLSRPLYKSPPPPEKQDKFIPWYHLAYGTMPERLAADGVEPTGEHDADGGLARKLLKMAEQKDA